jgi:hypothetical protein
MSDTKLDSFTIGAGKIIPVDHSGPVTYVAGGETLGVINNMTGISIQGLGSLDMVLGSGSLSESGNYWVLVRATGLGIRKTFLLQWFLAAAGVPTLTEAGGSGHVNLSAETVRLGYVGK